MLNLIDDPWIPVRTRTGDIEHIKPSEVAQAGDDGPYRRFASPRADLDGSLAQFMIGLLHLTFQPDHDDDWLDRYDNPPSRAELEQAFTGARDAFNLLGEGPRFLQDPSLEGTDDREIDALLIDAPGGSALRKNTDLFVHRTGAPRMCLPCTAAALTALQFNAPAGGRGHRVSLRGGGPMTTLLVGDDLWRTLWLNVLSSEDLEAPPEDPTDPSALLWMGDCPTSENKEVLTPEDVHAQHVFWSMPRRILLGDPAGSGTCMVCGREAEVTLEEYGTKAYGPNYEGGWRHPLTPYRRQSEEQMLPVLGQPGAISYRHWLGLVQVDQDEGSQPARIVDVFTARRAHELPESTHKLWAFAYDMDNMKPRGWKEGRMPLVLLPKGQREALERDTTRLVKAADHVAGATRAAVWQALVSAHSSNRGDIAHITDSFWARTEAGFFERLEALRSAGQDPKATQDIRRGWRLFLRQAALDEFDQRAMGETIAADHVRRVARARRKLRSEIDGKAVRRILMLDDKGLEQPQEAQ